MKKTIAAFVLVLALPLTASALTNQEIQTRIATLLAQIALLQQQIQAFNAPATTGQGTGAGISAALTCPNITRVLSLGMRGTDVYELQAYLVRDRYLTQASVTGAFDIATENAVKQWQSEHGLVFSGTAETTGYGLVGPRTRSLIALNCRAQQNSVQTITTGATQTGTGQLTCPIAPPPTTLCSTGWQALTDSYGCTKSYRCVTPLPGGGGQSFGSSTISISTSAAPRGGQVVVTWNFPSAPADSKVRLELYRSGDSVVEGNNDYGLANNASQLSPAGSYTWTVPVGAACVADAGYRSCVQNGTYKIVAKLYSGGTCWGFCSSNSTRSLYTTVESQLFGIY